MMGHVVLVDEFTGADGQALTTTLWGATQADGAGTVAIQSASARITNAAVGGYADRVFKPTVGGAPSGDFEMFLELGITNQTNEHYIDIGFRSSDVRSTLAGAESFAADGWVIDINPNSKTLALVRMIGNTRTNISSYDDVGVWTVGSYNLLVRCVGPSIQVNFWAVADPQPSSWFTETTDWANIGRTGFTLGLYGGAAAVATTYDVARMVVTDLTGRGRRAGTR